MLIVTSLSPSHKNKDQQKQAVESWKKLGHKIISINHISEMFSLGDYEVEFYEPKTTGIELFGKHYIPINEYLEVIKKEGSGLIINSDIILKGLPNLDKDAVIFSRHDFDNDIEKYLFFKSGYDGFYLTKEHCELYPITKLCTGNCHFDYFLPLVLIQRGIKIYTPKEPYLFHKKHDAQYSNWEQTFNIFNEEMGVSGHVAYSIIKNSLIQF